MFQKFERQSRHTHVEGFGQILVHDCDDGWMEIGDDERPHQQQQWKQKRKVNEIVRAGQQSNVVESVRDAPSAELTSGATSKQQKRTEGRRNRSLFGWKGGLMRGM